MTSVNLSAVAALPLFDLLRPLFERLEVHRFPSIEDLNGLIEKIGVVPQAGSGRPVRFVAPSPGASTYEERVFSTGEVATRADNWHDLFNALVWLSFPRVKEALNWRHCSVMEQHRARGIQARGPLRDAATLFDESGIVVASADPALTEMLRAHEWKTLFWLRRNEVTAQMRFFVFGHGLYDQLRAPFVGLCGKAVFVDVEPDFLDMPPPQQVSIMDRDLALRWRSDRWYRQPRELAVLPLLGIPGVAAQSEAAEYYDDLRQFRPRRSP